MRHSTTQVNRSKTVASFVIWLAIWQMAYLLLAYPLLLPSPLSVAGRLWELLLSAQFYSVIYSSFVRIFTGFLLGSLLGCVIALATAFSPFAHSFFSLPMNIIKATPVASFVILALVWISGQNLSVFISFLMVLPVVWSNVHTGLVQTDRSLLEMARVFALSRTKRLRYIYLPSALPYFISALRVGLGFCWKAGIAGEVIAIPRGTIGTQLYNAKIYLDTVDLFAWTAVIILLSVVIERVVLLLLPTDKSSLTKGANA